MTDIALYSSRSRVGHGAVLAFVAAFMIITLGGWQIIRSREGSLQDAEANIQITARTLAQHAARTVETVDLSLTFIVEQIENGRSPAQLMDLLKTRSILVSGQTKNVLISDNAGMVIADTSSSRAASNIFDRSYFGWHRDHPNDSLHIDELIVGRRSGEKGLPLSRRINGTGGVFQGVAMAALSPEYFRGFYKSIRIGEEGTVALWAEDGRMLLRYPELPGRQNSAAPVHIGDAFANQEGISRSVSPWDGIERIFAFSHVDKYPLIVSAAISVDDALSPWRREAASEAIVIVIAVTVLGLLGAALESRRRRVIKLEATSQEALRSLSESEARFQSLAMALSTMIQELGPGGEQSYVSPAAVEIFGIAPTAMIGADPLDFVHPDDTLAVAAMLDDLRRGLKDEARMTYRIRYTSGQWRWVEAIYCVERGASTVRPIRIIASLQDVTARRDLSDQLETSNRLLLMAEEVAGVGHWHYDVSTNKVTWSDEVYRIHACEPAKFTPTVETAINFYHPDDRDEVDRRVTDALEHRRNYEFSLRIVLSSGEIRFVLSRGICEVGPSGNVSALFGTIMDVTSLRKAELAVVKSEARFRLLADNTTDMVTQMDLNGRRIFVSPGSRDLLGYEPKELIDTNPQDMIHPDDADGLKRVFKDLAEGRIDRAINVNRLRHRDGHWIWVEASLKRLADADGASIGFVGAIRNIMDRKRADEALRESEGRYRLLADHSSDLIALKPSFEGGRTYVSPSSKTVLGYEPEEFAALPASNYVHPDDIGRVAAEYASLTVDAPEITSVHRVKHKAGHWIWIEAIFQLAGAESSERNVIVRARDVTARQEAELARAASEKRYKILAETTSDIIAQLDTSFVRQYVSPACRRILGYDPEEMTGLEAFPFIHPDDADRVRRMGQALLEEGVEGDRTVLTYRTRHKDGHWVWIENVMNLIRDELSGEPASLICSLRDITQRQQIAADLERAKTAAEAVARVKSDFMANMSHELRTPLTGILGIHDLLRADTALGMSHRRLIELASEAGRSLLAIVNDVLDFSKIEAGLLSIEHVPFDIDALISSCYDLIKSNIANRSVAITLTCVPATFGYGIGDPSRLRQVILNLLSNALKFTHTGNIEFAVALSDDEIMRVEIRDTGIGIPENRIDSLFERFTQADTSMSRQYGGTGLGLAISKRLVELMKGTIGAKRRPEGGSIFWFELPIVRGHGIISSAPEQRWVPLANRVKVLLAEDNALNAEIILAQLKHNGFEAEHVADGATAVAAVQASTFGVVLMDMQMPILDGLSASRLIREWESARKAPHTPIIGLTANAMEEDAKRCFAAGMDAHVAKPIDWPALFSKMAEFGRPLQHQVVIPPDHPNASSVLEIETLHELAGIIGHAGVADLLDRFIGELQTKLAIIEGDITAPVAQLMHALAATSGQFGFRELSAICADIDASLRQGKEDQTFDNFRTAARRALQAARSSAYAEVA